MKNIGLSATRGVSDTHTCPFEKWQMTNSPSCLTLVCITWTCLAPTGQYWGEMGYFRIVMGKNALGIESEVAWATLDSFTVQNFPCNEDGSNCHLDGSGMTAIQYKDPSTLEPRELLAYRR